MLLVFVVFFFSICYKTEERKKFKKKINLFRSKSHWNLTVVSVTFIFVHVSLGIEKYESLWIGFYGSWHVQIGKSREELTKRQMCLSATKTAFCGWPARSSHRSRSGQRLQAALVVTPSTLQLCPDGLSSPSHSC